MLWLRTIGSTCIGEFANSFIFCILAFYGQIDFYLILEMQLAMFLFKVLYEIVFTPLTYLLCFYIKGREGIEVFDVTTSFNPFKLFDLEYSQKELRKI
jgi:uncharacterized PurR-regulated membrane protein YhhQ (DUF165 family)